LCYLELSSRLKRNGNTIIILINVFLTYSKSKK